MRSAGAFRPKRLRVRPPRNLGCGPGTGLGRFEIQAGGRRLEIACLYEMPVGRTKA
jgi:hypothetical protein